MSRLVWGEPNSLPYELGVERGVLYPTSAPGVAWQGLKSIDEASENGVSSVYFEGVKVIESASLGVFNATIDAFMYPEELENGTTSFSGLVYQTKLSNSGYRTHLVYNPKFYLDSKGYMTVAETFDPTPLNWNLSATPIHVTGYTPFSHIYFEAPLANKSLLLRYIEEILYGGEDTDPTILMPDVLIKLFSENPSSDILLILDHGDGSWTAIGSDEVVRVTGDTSFEIASPSSIFVNETTYNVSSI